MTAPLAPLLVVLTGAPMGAPARTLTLLDTGWKFHLNDAAPPSCNASNFPTKRNDVQCMGLSEQAQADSADSCRDQCCSIVGCEVWQWCPKGSACSPSETCWVGKANDCAHKGTSWQGASRTVPPSPPPSPGQPCDSPYCKTDYDDAKWRRLDLPHDFVVEQNFSSTADKAHGYLPYATGWYRHTFTLPSEAREGASVWLTFEGVQRNSVVYLNGEYLCRHLS
jgi:hypothetical protein